MNKISVLFLLVTVFLVLIDARLDYEAGWVQSADQVDGDHPVFFRIYLKHQNLDKLDEKVRDVSSPRSAHYGQYLTASQIMDVIQPRPESVEVVLNWVESYNPISVNTDAKDVVKVAMRKKNAEEMFNVQLCKFVHVMGTTVLRSEHDPVISFEYMEHIDLITGISTFPIIKNRKLREEVGSSEPTKGLNILGLKGQGHTSTLTFTPSCSPSCSSSQFNPINVFVSAVNTAVNQSISSPSVQPTCALSSSGSYYQCTALFSSLLYLPTKVMIQDTVTGSSASFPYTFVSTPVVTPQSIKAYYGVPQGYMITQNITQSVVEFEQQYISNSDLDLFVRAMGLPYNYSVTYVGPNNASNIGVEASLDIQYIMGVAANSPIVFWSIASNATFTEEGVDDILSWATEVFNADTASQPLVNSISYGISENYVAQFLGKSYMARSDIEFEKLALLGLTILVSSMDSGAGALGSAPPMEQSCSPLSGGYPSQSIYVTSVGATYFTPLDQPVCYEPVPGAGISCIDQPIGEVGVSIDYSMMWTSGGMFSNYTARPWYQEEAVSSYLNNYASIQPPSSLFNSSGRAYPDVSAVGHNLYIVVDGKWTTVDGTSASAPIFAGLITILNDVRMKAGKSPLGFINPLFYQIQKDYPEAFYDVTVGNNRCGEFNMPNAPTCCPYGFEAAPGYDIPGGIGRPNMEVLMDIITQY